MACEAATSTSKRFARMVFSTRLRTFGLILASLFLANAGRTAILPRSTLLNSFPVREIAGVPVVDTLVVRDAELYMHQHSSDWLYKHVMRSLLFGAVIIQHNDTLASAIDMETHAVATLLHDFGWERQLNSSIVTADRRFEVDGAIAARDFLHGHGDGQHWDDSRVQLVWDSIVLHTERSIAYYKELTVQVVSKGISMDFSGPAFGVTDEEYAAVLEQFPQDDLVEGVNNTFIWLCQTKPATTYGQSTLPTNVLLARPEALILLLLTHLLPSHRHLDATMGR